MKTGSEGVTLMSEGIKNTYQKKKASKVRKIYTARLVGRCIVFLLSIALFILRPEELEILQGGNFFKKLSVLHLLWIIWVMDMFFQLVPAKNHISLGSQKLFKERFKPITDKINYQALKDYVISTTKSAYRVFILWALLILVLGVFYYRGILNASLLFLISVAFYVCDLICVLIWCPFRLIMKNRCCTT